MRIQTHPVGSALLHPTPRGRRVTWFAALAGLLLTGLGFILRAAPIDAPAVEAFNRMHIGAWGRQQTPSISLSSPSPPLSSRSSSSSRSRQFFDLYAPQSSSEASLR